MMLPYDLSRSLSIILYLKTNSGLLFSYLHDVWHFQKKLELKVFWTIFLFSTRVNRNLSPMQVWHPQCVSVLEFLLSWISDNLSPKHFLCIGVWHDLETKELSILLFIFILTFQTFTVLRYHVWADFSVRHLDSNLLTLTHHLWLHRLQPSQKNSILFIIRMLLTSNAWVMWAILTDKILIPTEALIGIFI